MFNNFDPKHDPLLRTPFPIFTLLGVYLVFVLKIGKILMRNRPPYDVQKILLIYNIIQILYNGYIFCVCFKWVLLYPVYNLGCMESLPVNHPKKWTEGLTGYLYLWNKILDLLDTIFIVLRKNWKQVTLLHVYHHAGMVLAGYFIVNSYGYGGHICITTTLNSFVHIIMYTYYFLSALSPKVKNNLWWKIYITKFQLVQFLIIFLHTVYVMLISKDCKYPKFWLWIHFTQSLVMMFLFGNFYMKAYKGPVQQNRRSVKFN